MSPLLSWALAFALGCLALAMALSLARMILGPRAEDRVVAFDCLYMNTMLVVLTLGLIYRSSSYFEAALLIALFGFVGSTAMAKFLLRGEVIE
ncbi:K+/H+ antiporter subunit F [Pyxidicoccus trucidator]|jgi:multicomponent K+:H+ antiporter subunit F|uniref:K+/H+ antiporter subunit F n=1 Tax=Pyxidicoccus trucidator TaxID=2709662 RepID=UPI0013D93B00|nr:K+/H+ antiporter subunit F [Pyxidicoccus trucidator]